MFVTGAAYFQDEHAESSLPTLVLSSIYSFASLPPLPLSPSVLMPEDVVDYNGQCARRTILTSAYM